MDLLHNLIYPSSSHDTLLQQIRRKSADSFLSNPANRQANRLGKNVTSLAEVLTRMKSDYFPLK